jgi:GNAT superfamily N-acetyltransferase
MITYRIAITPEEFAIAAQLFQEYARSLPIDLGFQGFEHELQDIAGQYAAPSGALLLAYANEAAIGCTGVRHLGPGVAELKRMYLRSEHRGQGIGRELLERCISVARELGYTRIRLDTLPHMAPALGLYRTLGFTPISAYRFNPVADAVYMEKVL